MKYRLLIAGAAMAALTAGGAAQAAVVIATVADANTGFVSSPPTPGGAFVGNGKSTLSFLIPGDPAGLTGQLMFNAVTTTAVTGTTVSGPDTTYTLGGFTGSFTDVYEGVTQTIDGVHLVRGSTVLLSGDISDGLLTLPLVGGVAEPGTFAGLISDYSSAYPIAGVSNGSFDLDLTPKKPGDRWHTSKGVLSSFNTSASGDFAGIPEPATWSMLLVGFLGLGSLLRRVKPKSLGAVAAA